MRLIRILRKVRLKVNKCVMLIKRRGSHNPVRMHPLQTAARSFEGSLRSRPASIPPAVLLSLPPCSVSGQAPLCFTLCPCDLLLAFPLATPQSAPIAATRPRLLTCTLLSCQRHNACLRASKTGASRRCALGLGTDCPLHTLLAHPLSFSPAGDVVFHKDIRPSAFTVPLTYLQAWPSPSTPSSHFADVIFSLRPSLRIIPKTVFTHFSLHLPLLDVAFSIAVKVKLLSHVLLFATP